MEILLFDLKSALENVYKKCNFICDNFVQETESQEYGACEFKLDNRLIKFRIAKATPKKIGQFVTFWKRDKVGSIIPYDHADSFHFLVISVRKNARIGQFVFPKQILLEKGIISKENKGGKRAMRVYAPWDRPTNLQAQKSQAWHIPYFFEFNILDTDLSFIQTLFRAQ